MRNIPTDLLRALITVVDLQGFTRAGAHLGRTQPTISLQIKRLQELVGVTLLEREAGVSRLTEAGEVCAAYARRILALHDEMTQRLTTQGAGSRLRIGLPNDYADHFLPQFLGQAEAAQPGLRFEIVCDISAHLLRDLRDGALDMAIVMTSGTCPDGAWHAWSETLTWIGTGQAPSADRPVNLVAAPEGCIYRRVMLAALQQDGRQADIVCTTPSLTGIEAALRAGLGITAMAARMAPLGLVPPHGLPDLPEVSAGIYLNPRARGRQIQLMAALLRDVLAAPPITQSCLDNQP